MWYVWDAAVAFDPRPNSSTTASGSGSSKPDLLRALFRGAGLSDVEVQAIDVPTPFADFDDYWTPFLGGRLPRQLCHVAR
jgi:hypothetical protein